MKSPWASEKRIAFFLIFPTVFLIVLVFIFPLIYSTAISFCELYRGEWQFVGLGNYLRLFKDEAFWNSAWVSLTFTTTVVAAHFILGLGAALLLDNEFRGRAFARIVMLIPWMIAPSIVGVIWRWVWDSQFGIGNALLYKLGLISTYLPWLGDTMLAPIAVIIASTWRGFPFVGMILLAGLQAIPEEQYEAAAVDGASLLGKFRYITLPNLKHVIMVALTLDSIWTIRSFDQVFTLTRGGPASTTEILPIGIYLQSFSYMRFGYASAMSVVLFLFLLVFTIVYMYLARPVEMG